VNNEVLRQSANRVCDLQRISYDAIGLRRIVVGVGDPTAFLHHPGERHTMSVGTTLPATLPLPASSAASGARHRAKRVLGAILAEAEMSEIAAFDFAGGTAAVYTTRSPGKATPNEDVAALLPISASAGVLAVADGLGGHVGGEKASRLAIETIQGTLLEAVAASAESRGDDLRGTILDGIEAANRQICELGTGAATTLALIEVRDRTIRPYHVGDSVIPVTPSRPA
jgi:hypothetical protein